MSTIDRLRDALRAEVESITVIPDTGGLAAALQLHDRRRSVRRTIVAATAAASVAAGFGIAAAHRTDSRLIETPPADSTPAPDRHVAPKPEPEPAPAPAEAAPSGGLAVAPVGGRAASVPAGSPPAPAPPPHQEPPPSPPAPPPGVSFSASYTWGSCGENPPYDEYYGTANPGSAISVSSSYGGGSTTADAAGHWYVKVFFPSAPVGVPFDVTVSSAQGSQTFTFTRTA